MDIMWCYALVIASQPHGCTQQSPIHKTHLLWSRKVSMLVTSSAHHARSIFVRWYSWFCYLFMHCCHDAVGLPFEIETKCYFVRYVTVRWQRRASVASQYLFGLSLKHAWCISLPLWDGRLKCWFYLVWTRYLFCGVWEPKVSIPAGPGSASGR